MYKILVSRTFQKQFNKLDKEMQKRVKNALKQSMSNPFSARSKADIKQIKGTFPVKYRIGIGNYRIIYTIYKKDKVVKVIELMKREKEYGRMD